MHRRRVLALRVARGTHSSWLIIPVTLLVLCQRLHTYIPGRTTLHHLQFLRVPVEFPLGYRIKVSLQKGGIVLGFDAAVEDAIISKETDCATDGFVGEVVDVYQT